MPQNSFLKKILGQIDNDLIREFAYQTAKTVQCSVRNNARRINILTNVFNIKHRTFEHYQQQSILNDPYIKKLIDKNPKDSQTSIDEFYLLQTAFINLYIDLYDYEQIIEIGSFNGKLIAPLAKLHPDKHFFGYDIVSDFEKLNEIYNLRNLKFIQALIDPEVIQSMQGRKTLLISKGTMCCLEREFLDNFLSMLFQGNIDICSMEPCSYRANKQSHIIKAGKSGNTLISHPYNYVYNKAGYDVVYNSQNIGLSYIHSYFKPYYLTFCYARARK